MTTEESILEDIMNITGCKKDKAHELLKSYPKATKDETRLQQCLDRYFQEIDFGKDDSMEIDSGILGSSSLTGNKRQMGNRSPDTMSSGTGLDNGRWRDTRTPLRSLDLDGNGMSAYRSTSSAGLPRGLNEWQASRGTGGSLRSGRRSLTGYPTNHNGRPIGTRTSTDRYDPHSYMDRERNWRRNLLGDEFSG